MILSCDNPDCAIAETGRCARAAEFTDPIEECPELISVEEPSLVEAPVSIRPNSTAPSGQATPWSGESLSPTECWDVLARSQPTIVAVAGPHDAGKTSLLVALFLQIANGALSDFPYRFASSRSLLGFHRLAQRAAQWSGEASEAIVDHTPANQSLGRFLHLGLRPAERADDRHLDVLLSDIPGEWFKTWSSAPASELRVQFVRRAHAVLVVADASKAENRKYDAKIGQLIERIIDARRQVALIFAKMDLVDQESPEDPLAEPAVWAALGKGRRVWRQIQRARSEGLWGAVYGVSAFPKPLTKGRAIGVLRPIRDVIQGADKRVRWCPSAPPIAAGATGFDTFRRREPR